MRCPTVGRQPQRKILVPLTGFEPVFPLNREADPESAASASSATGACMRYENVRYCDVPYRLIAMVLPLGFEPRWACAQQPLRLPCLPIPPRELLVIFLVPYAVLKVRNPIGKD